MSSQLKSFLSNVVFGGIFVGVGALIFLVAMDVINVPPEDIHAPRWVLAVIGIVFSLAGAMVMIQGLKTMMGDHPIFKWIYNGMVVIFMILFALPFHWVAFAPGEIEFSTSTSIPFVSISTSGSDLSGRLAFGCGAVLIDLLLINIVISILRGKDLNPNSDHGAE